VKDYAAYLDWLREGALKHGCAVHAYVLMTNHVHLLLTPATEASISQTMQFLGRKYVTFINYKYRRTGTLWEGRHKGSVIDSVAYALACSRYIEMNPVRAGIIDLPAGYRWSSYRHNAHGEGPDWLLPTAEYLALGNDARERQFGYRELFRCALEAEEVHAIRTCVQSGTPLGNDQFREQIARMTGRSVGEAVRGRPRDAARKGY